MIQMWLLTRKSGFDPPSGSHQLPVFLKYPVRLKLLAQLVHMWECKTFAAGDKVFVHGVYVMKDRKICGFNWEKPQMTISAKLQSSHVRHQYGIFGGKSQTSFTRNATQAGSEEGQLFSQATFKYMSLETLIFPSLLPQGYGHLIWTLASGGRDIDAFWLVSMSNPLPFPRTQRVGVSIDWCIRLSYDVKVHSSTITS